METHLPCIGQPTIYNVTKKGTSHSRKKRKVELTFDSIILEPNNFPTVVIVKGPSGGIIHAFTTIDGIILDAITSFAMPLNWESIKWIFGSKDTHITAAYRFENSIDKKAKGYRDKKLVLGNQHSCLGNRAPQQQKNCVCVEG